MGIQVSEYMGNKNLGIKTGIGSIPEYPNTHISAWISALASLPPKLQTKANDACVLGLGLSLETGETLMIQIHMGRSHHIQVH